MVENKLHRLGDLDVGCQWILVCVMGQVVNFGVLLIWKWHTVMGCMEEGLVLFQQRKSLDVVVVPSDEAHCDVKWGMYDRC